MAATRSIDAAALLKFWRQDVLGLSLRAAADRLGIAPATVWQWENGETKPRLDPLTIDRLLGARGALGGLLWAAGTPDGLDADTQWARVFRRGADATWIWVRPLDPDNPPEIAAEWGITSTQFSLPAKADGAIYWVPLSMPEQPLFVRLSTPGWVDFGQGQPPHRVLDLRVVDSRESVERVGYPSQALGHLARRAANGATGRRLANDDIRRRLPDRLAATLLTVDRGDQHPSWVERVTASSLTPHQPPDDVDRAAFRRLRLARNLSYRELAVRLADELDTAVSADTIRRFETRPERRPRFADLDAAIDRALDGDGRLAVRPVATSATADRVDFPPTWLAPVWVALTGVRRRSVVRLVWGRWTKDLEVEADTVVSMQCVQPHRSLRIESSHDIEWVAGIGYRPGSRPIDRNWLPVDLRAATEIQSLALDRAATAFGLSRRWIRRLFAP